MVKKPVQLAPSSWVRNRADEPVGHLENRFFEVNPANQQEQAALIERPALVEFLDAGDGPTRRLYRQPGFSTGDLFQISGADLYKHHMEVTRLVTTTQISGVVDGTGSPDMAATADYLFITDGTALQYTDGTTALASIATPDGIPMISLDVFNGYVLCVQNNSDRFYWLQPGAITFNGLDFATAEKLPDRIWQVRTVGDEFWLLGEETIEVWRATGDGDSPFQRIEARRYDFGIFGGTAVRLKDTSVCVVSDDGTVYRIAGVPEPISNTSVAERTTNAIFTAIEEGFG